MCPKIVFRVRSECFSLTDLAMLFEQPVLGAASKKELLLGGAHQKVAPVVVKVPLFLWGNFFLL